MWIATCKINDMRMADTLNADHELAETPDLYGAFPRLSEGQIASLIPHGDIRTTNAGDVLYAEGQLPYDFVVVLEGKVAVIQSHGSAEQQVLGVHGAGRFLGEISLLTGLASFVSAVPKAVPV
jgi:thioredoxin reductase (NADPH)